MIIVRTERVLAVVAMGSAVVAWFLFQNIDLVLSHYDARAHLVVARRVIDNITPGWQQVGAVTANTRPSKLAPTDAPESLSL